MLHARLDFQVSIFCDEPVKFAVDGRDRAICRGLCHAWLNHDRGATVFYTVNQTHFVEVLIYHFINQKKQKQKMSAVIWHLSWKRI